MPGQVVTFRELSKEVRELTLRQVLKVLKDEECKNYDKEFRNALLLRLSQTVLPRLAEVTGEDGGALQIVVKRANENEGDTTLPSTGQSDIQPAEV